MQDFEPGGRNSGCHESLFRQDLVKGGAALTNSLTGIRNPPFLEQGLQSTVLTECSMDEVEDEIRFHRKMHLGTDNLHFFDMSSCGAEGIRHRGAGAEGDITLGTGPSFEDGQMT
jgi:hypothetical protein